MTLFTINLLTNEAVTRVADGLIVLAATVLVLGLVFNASTMILTVVRDFDSFRFDYGDRSTSA